MQGGKRALEAPAARHRSFSSHGTSTGTHQCPCGTFVDKSGPCTSDSMLAAQVPWACHVQLVAAISLAHPCRWCMNQQEDGCFKHASVLMGRPVEGNEARVTLRKHVRICVCVYMYIDIGCTMSSRRGHGVVLAKRRPCFACSFYFISLSQSIYAFLLSSFARPDVALLKPQRQTRQKCQASPCLDDAPRALQQARHHQLATKDLQSSALVQRASQPAVHAA